ncbi:MAG: hypothetical protein AB1476_06135 [Candidatus Hadarchaeota archaeon]
MSGLFCVIYGVATYTFKTSTDIDNPPAPELISPKSGATIDNTPEFEWSSVDDSSGVSYELQYSNSPDLPDEWLHGWEFRRAVTVNLAGDQEEGIVTDGLVGR